MRRGDVTPVATNVGILFAFAVSLAGTALFSTGVHEGSDNVYSMLACTALVVLVSQCTYFGVTALQYAYALVVRKRGRDTHALPWAKRPVPDERVDEKPNERTMTFLHSTCTPAELVLNTIDFQHKRSEIRLWVTREHLWYSLYMFPTGVYGAFLCVPVYDPACTVCFAFGLFLAAVRVEGLRGRMWRRPVARRVLFAGVCSLGLMTFTLAFAVAYLSMLKNTNVAWQWVDNATAALPANATHAVVPVARADLAQYLTWFEHAYPRKTWVWWLVCLCAPVLLDFVPASMRLPVVLETSQMPLTSIALGVLCYVSAATRESVFDFIATQHAIGNVYFLVAGASTWAAVFCLCFCVRRRSFLLLSAPLLLVAFAKSARLLDVDVWRDETRAVLIGTGVVFSSYVASLVYFCRCEDVAVRTGWGSGHGTGSEPCSDSELDESLDTQAHSACFTTGHDNSDEHKSDDAVEDTPLSPRGV